MGLFRPTKPGTKVLQYLLQSHEIRFGDAMEELIGEILTDLGFSPLSKAILGADNRSLSLDQYCQRGGVYYVIEQKVRDDHDSTKKRGQLSNFESKVEALTAVHGTRLVGIMYFVDPLLTKNRGYYQPELQRLSQFYGVSLHLFYGSELFDYVDHPEEWERLLDALRRWKDGLPDLPEINFDTDPEASFREIHGLGARSFRRLMENDELWADGIMHTLFRQGTTLRMLLDFFRSRSEPYYQQLAESLAARLERHYS